MWQTKANGIIAALCKQAYLRANTKKDGTLYKRHRPYSVPLEAEELIKALDTNDEHKAKSLFLHNYTISKTDWR